MIPLARHIETLLLRHDCVVVPSFGGFITNYVEAQPELHETQGVVYPPYRVVRFNPSLTQNDGLLVGSYMTAYDAAYPAAEKQMRQDVNRMVDTLKLDGVYELGNIGTLRMDLSRHVTLEAHESGIATPLFYGLSSLEMQSAEAVEAERKLKEAIELTTIVPVVPAADETKEHGEDITLTIRRRWVDIAISAAAAVLLFFLFSYPMLREPATSDVVVASPYRQTQQQQAQQTQTQQTHPQQTHPQPLPVREGSDCSEQLTSTSSEKVNTPLPHKEEQEESQHQFSIVLASYVAEPNALEYVEKLAKAGLKEGRFERTGKVSRVLYARYASKEEAEKALKQLREQSEEFAEAWVYEYE